MKKKKNKKIVKSTKHSIKFANQEKKNLYYSFLKEYRRVAQIYLDYLWNYGWICEVDEQILIFDVPTKRFELPKFIDKELNEILNIKTSLSARALSSCITQTLGCLKASTEKRRRQLYILEKLKRDGEDYTKLQEKIDKPLKKPKISNINPELSTKCCDFQQSEKHFDGFLQLKSIGNSFGRIRIPVKFHNNSNKWKEIGKIKTSFLFSKKYISIRWEIPKQENKTEGLVVGADQGLKDVLTLSNETITPKFNNHGFSLEKITKILARKKKGSKSFKKTQEHRKNFINWSINQLNLSNIKEIRVEKIINIGYKSKRSRYISHWTNTLIRDKLLNRCEESKVLVIQQSSTYRSQRCSACGKVRKANRKGKGYKCSCGFVCDADLNAARNHEQELPDIPTYLRKLRRNLGKGFYWKLEGFFELTGEEIRVPLPKK